MTCEFLGYTYSITGGMCSIELFIIFSPVVIGLLVGLIVCKCYEKSKNRTVEENVKLANEMTEEIKTAFLDTYSKTQSIDKSNQAAFAIWKSYANQYPDILIIQDFVYQAVTNKLIFRIRGMKND